MAARRIAGLAAGRPSIARLERGYTIDGSLGSKQFRRILKEWHGVHWRYVARSLSHSKHADCIWWALERSNVGALAAAAWLAEVPCLEEFVDYQGKKDRRVDLWLDTSLTDRPGTGQGTHVEAKMLWLHADTATQRDFLQQLVSRLSEAAEQMEHLHSESHKLALVFVVPSVRNWHGNDPIAAWHLLRRAAQSEVQRRAEARGEEWFSSWLTCDWFAVDTCPPRWPTRGRQRYYPGVLAIGLLHVGRRSRSNGRASKTRPEQT